MLPDSKEVSHVTYHFRPRAQWLVRILLVLCLAVVVLGMLQAYRLGFAAGEQRVQKLIHIDSVLPQEDGCFSVVLGYEDQTMLHVFYPWWLYQSSLTAKGGN